MEAFKQPVQVDLQIWRGVDSKLMELTVWNYLLHCSLALAETLGADVCLNPQSSATPAEVGEWLKASLPPYGPDIVIDCAGFQSTLQVCGPTLFLFCYTAFLFFFSFFSQPRLLLLQRCKPQTSNDSLHEKFSIDHMERRFSTLCATCLSCLCIEMHHLGGVRWVGLW